MTLAVERDVKQQINLNLELQHDLLPGGPVRGGTEQIKQPLSLVP